MVHPKYSPIEALKRAKLMMGYDPSKTLSENKITYKKRILAEDSPDTAAEMAVVKILQGCSGRPAAEGTLDAASVASAFNEAFNYQTWGMFGGTNDSLWREQAEIMKKGNYDDLCNISKEYADLGFGDFALDLVDDLDDEELSELMRTFSAMKYRSDKEAKLAVATTEQKNINWFKKQFPCVFDTNSNVDQSVKMNRNNYVYILVKGKSGKIYQLYTDGRLKNEDESATGKKLACQGSKVTLVGESVVKKKLKEQFDDSEMGGGGGGGTVPPPVPRPHTTWRNCEGKGTYSQGCKAEIIKKVQDCLGLSADGKFGPKTKKALDAKGYTTFKDEDVDKICGKKPVDPDIEDADPSDATEI